MEASGLDIANAVGNMVRNSEGNELGASGGLGVWLLIILFFIMFAGGGFGGFGSNNAVNEISNEFLYTNLNNQLGQGFNQVANQNFNIERAIDNGMNSVNSNIAESRYATQNCCCETNRNIDALRYDGAKNTCDIITAGQANTQRIIDYMQNEKIDQLRTDLQAAQLQLSNNSQTSTLISALRPYPVPSYITCSPYVASNMYNAYSGLYGCSGCNA